MTEFAPFGGGYDTGHCWYYRLGGRILKPEEIVDRARGEEAHKRFVQDYSRFDRMEEPRRSNELKAEQQAVERNMQDDIDRYLECVAEVERLRIFIGPEPYDWFKQTYQEPYTAISLKHNHISYNAAKLRALRTFQQQGDLFG